MTAINDLSLIRLSTLSVVLFLRASAGRKPEMNGLFKILKIMLGVKANKAHQCINCFFFLSRSFKLRAKCLELFTLN